MSVVVDEMPPRRFPRRRYDWGLWTDGRIHLLSRGADFDVTAKQMVHAAYKWATDHDLKVTTRFFGDQVWLRFYRTRSQQLRSVG